MELLVVLGLFSLAVTMASAIFLQSNRAQRRVLAVSAAQSDLRFALELMVREIRTGRIDYPTYAETGGVSIPSPRLFVIDGDGGKEEFYLENSPLVCTAPSTRCLAVRLNGSAPQPVTSSGLDVERLAFHVNPQVDPYVPEPGSGAFGADQQPVVTIVMHVRTAGAAVGDIVRLQAQTTAASRTYAR